MHLIGAAAAVRVALLAYASWVDVHSEVKYTDIDYVVFSDAASLVAQGRSPYERSTYRYSPFLALLLLPNAWFAAWGKCLFCLADLAGARVLETVLIRLGASQKLLHIAVSLFLFDPFTLAISTRGSSDSLTTLLVLWLTHLVLEGRHRAAGCLLGLAVHWRIYPAIYGLPVVLCLRAGKGQARSQERWPVPHFSPGTRQLEFIASSACTFVLLGGAAYAWCGNDFVHSTYLYHLSRQDPRHNFAMHFYGTYLNESTPEALEPFKRFNTILQCLCTAAIGVVYSDHLPVCLMLQTHAFVAFNTVVTAQYFAWYLSLLPMALPWLKLRRLWPAAAGWAGAQVHWLSWAYLLEIQGRPVFLQVWCASVLFFFANIVLFCQLVQSLQPCCSLSDGEILHGRSRRRHCQVVPN